jgi:hypothetical protein
MDLRFLIGLKMVGQNNGHNIQLIQYQEYTYSVVKTPIDRISIWQTVLILAWNG